MKAFKLQKLKNKIVLISAIQFIDLYKIIKFTNRQPSTWDPYDINYNNDFENSNEYYQRLVDTKRVNSIENFIKESFSKQETNSDIISTIFPSSMIIAFDSEYNFNEDEDVVNYSLPDFEESCLIVDGQHRMAAMISLYKKLLHKKSDTNESYLISKIEKYKFNCTVLVNFDLWEQAQLFINVNFNQKSVSKSLYYDIFGSIPNQFRNDKDGAIYISHELVKYLNNSEKSPIKGFVKMLGTGEGFLSQAFFVESILIHFGTRGVWSKIGNDYSLNKKSYEILPKIFISYFEALLKVFPDYWPKINETYNNILFKTTGMGALIRLLGLVYKNLNNGTYPNLNKVDFEKISKSELTDIFTEVFIPLKKNGKVLFSKDGDFSGTGGAGLQSKLYRRLIQELNLESNSESKSI
jgi:DGQHR domain-containing protein